ncbi:MAG: helix-turn-helix domain-containing protein [Pseudomonadota bacterium]
MKKLRSFSQAILILARRLPAVVNPDGSINKTELAKLAGLNQPTMQRILKEGEQKTISTASRDRLAKLLKCTPGQIEGIEPIPEIDGDLPTNSAADYFTEFVTKNALTATSIPMLYLTELSGVDSSHAAQELRKDKTRKMLPMPITLGLSESAFLLVIDEKIETEKFMTGESVVIDPEAVPKTGGYVLIKVEDALIAVFRSAKTDSGYRFIPESNLFQEIHMNSLEWPFIGVCRAGLREF